MPSPFDATRAAQREALKAAGADTKPLRYSRRACAAGTTAALADG